MGGDTKLVRHPAQQAEPASTNESLTVHRRALRSRDGSTGPRGAVKVDGKQFVCGDDRFHFRGVTYGTFEPRADGNRYPERDQVKLDFAAMREAGFTVVRTYTVPPDDVLELAADWGLRLLVGVYYPDWRYMVGASRREARRIARAALAEVRAASRRFAGNEHVLALCLGNEVPADVVRWVGASVVSKCLRDLADAVKAEDPTRLVTYANYPSAEYLSLDFLDFLTFNVFLERRSDFRAYLTRLQHLAGDRPLVIGELGLDAGEGIEGERRQAETLDWQLETAVERGMAGTCMFSWTDDWWVGDARVEGWSFGLTRADRTPRPALATVRRWNQRTVADLSFDWPSISVVVCAYNAEATLSECLEHTCALEYPDLEILVVDDGSTDATAEIARRYPRARLVGIPHSGLSVARNEGYRAPRGELIAYLDSDAYPTPEWPYYLALGMDDANVGGVGGPNVPPVDDPPSAHQVARAPGGPVHVLLSDDRAEHIPGCNMAFWRQVLVDTGGFDPIYTAAGDDVDFAWRVLDAGWEIAFHPAALVWHHRRAGLRAYLRQQRGYGRSEALVEARHPDRFTAAGTARWRGAVYTSRSLPLGRQRIYRGPFGAAAYQSVYRSGGYGLDLAHQVGVPVAAAIVLTAPLGLLAPVAMVPALLALALLLVPFAIDTVRAAPPRDLVGGSWRFRAMVGLMHLLQPVARMAARYAGRARSASDDPATTVDRPAQRVAGGALLMTHDSARPDLTAAVVSRLRHAGASLVATDGWQDYDARLRGSALIAGHLVTSGFPVGHVQIRLRHRLRPRSTACWLAACAMAGAVEPRAAGCRCMAPVRTCGTGCTCSTTSARSGWC